MNKILFVSAHPDDETLGSGGTILKHKDNGDEIYWMITTNISVKNEWDKEVVSKRQDEIELVSKAYGFKKLYKLDYTTTKLDTIPISELINSISKVMNEVKPHTVYLPNRSDVHTDHQIAFKAIWSCTKNFRCPFIKKILMYETLSETEFSPALSETFFIPNVFADISDYFEKKLVIMKIFGSEVMEKYLPRSLSSIEALARFRGSRINVKYAEAFVLIEEIL